MKDFMMSFPIWFWIVIISVIVGAVVYRFARFGIKIKAGSVEIDASVEEPVKEETPVEEPVKEETPVEELPKEVVGK
jgi:Na+/H+ antiporter NhaC